MVMQQISDELAETAKESIANDASEPALTKDLPPRDARLAAQLSDAVKTGEVDPRSSLGQRFKREMSESEAAEYKQLGTDCDRAEFRKAWAKRRLDTIVAGKTSEKTWRRINTELGEYLTLPALAVSWGFAADPEGALKHAQTYAKRCISLGGAWTEWDEMSEQVFYLVLKKQHREEFSKAWTLFEKSYTQKTAPNALAPTSQGRSRLSEWFGPQTRSETQ